MRASRLEALARRLQRTAGRTAPPIWVEYPDHVPPGENRHTPEELAEFERQGGVIIKVVYD